MFICGSVPDGIVDQGDHVLGNIVVRQAVTEGDGQILLSVITIWETFLR